MKRHFYRALLSLFLAISLIGGFAFFTVPPPVARGAIAEVQTNSGAATGGGTTTMSSTWGSATTAGNLLVAALAFDGNPGIVTPPAGGWTLADTSSGAQEITKLYYIENASSQSGSKTWNWSGGVSSAVVILAEYSGVATSGSLDQHTSGIGNSSSPTASSITTTSANELLIGVLGQGSGFANNFSAPTNSFNIYNQLDGGDFVGFSHIGLLDRIVSSTGTYSTGVTSSQSGIWGAVTASFKAIAVGGGSSGGGSSGSPTAGTITVKKTTLGGNGIFNFNTTGTGYLPFNITTSNGIGFNVQSVPKGTYSAIETVPKGWTKNQDTCQNLSVAIGKDVQCSVVNALNGYLQVKLTTIGGDGTFVFTAKSPSYTSDFNITTSSGSGSILQQDISPDTYTIAETVPDGWTKTQDTCSGIIVPPGQTGSCAVTNVKNGILKVKKITMGGDDTFNFTTKGQNYINFSITTSSNSGSNIQSLPPGTYSAIETVPGDWTKTQDTCQDVTVTTNTTTECMVVNLKEAPLLPLPPIKPSPTPKPKPEPAPVPQPSPQPVPQPQPQPIVQPSPVVQEQLTIPREVQKAIQTPQGSVATKAVSTLGASTSIIAVATAVTSSFSVSDLLLVLFRILGTVATALGIKKRITYWGVVYDAVTKQPLDPAQVVLKDLKGNVIATAITDIDGRYGFLVPPGTYKLEAAKTNYAFPSQKLAGKTEDEIYSNVYKGQEIAMAGGSVLTQNIPLDPVNFDWNEFAKRSKTFMKFYSKWDLFLRRIYDLYFVIGFFVAIVAFIFAPYPYNTIILGIYIILLVLRLIGLKPKSFGYVVEHGTGNPLSFAVLKIMMPSTDIQVSQKVADQYGRYYCLVPKGKYRVKVEKKNDDQSYASVYTSPVIDASRQGIIKKKFQV
jgi:hypothetical protein